MKWIVLVVLLLGACTPQQMQREEGLNPYDALHCQNSVSLIITDPVEDEIWNCTISGKTLQMQYSQGRWWVAKYKQEGS